MKRIRKIGRLVIMFILTVCNTCFADVVMPSKEASSHGSGRIQEEIVSVGYADIFSYILVGIFIVALIVCTIIIIRKIVKKKKDKTENDK